MKKNKLTISFNLFYLLMAILLLILFGVAYIWQYPNVESNAFKFIYLAVTVLGFAGVLLAIIYLITFVHMWSNNKLNSGKWLVLIAFMNFNISLLIAIFSLFYVLKIFSTAPSGAIIKNACQFIPLIVLPLLFVGPVMGLTKSNSIEQNYDTLTNE